jgi:exosortase/archaeosortase family protein
LTTVTGASVAEPRVRAATARAAAVVVAAAGLAVLFAEPQVRRLEAVASAAVFRVTSLARAHAVGTSVIFPHGSRWIGFTVAVGCSAALLIAPFFFVAAALLLSGRVSLRRGLLTLLAVSTVVWAVNQLRLLVIGASMQLWGFATGYSRSHVLAGGVLSTFGVAIGVVAFLSLLLSHRDRSRGTTEADS